MKVFKHVHLQAPNLQASTYLQPSGSQPTCGNVCLSLILTLCVYLSLSIKLSLMPIVMAAYRSALSQHCTYVSLLHQIWSFDQEASPNVEFKLTFTDPPRTKILMSKIESVDLYDRWDGLEAP